jgi:hypothetical protein
LEQDLVTQKFTLTRHSDAGCFRIRSSGLEREDTDTDIFAIVEGEPASAMVRCERMVRTARGEWDIRIETESELTSDATPCHVTNAVNAYESGVKVFAKTWHKVLPRDMM